MKVLVISDIHSNLAALEAVLLHAGEVDAVWCLGDIVGYGPDPNECISLVKTLPKLTCLVGNHDAAALGRIDFNAFNHEARLSATWTQQTLNAESLAFLESLPETQELENVTLTHGSPRNPVWEYLLDVYTARYNFDYFSTPVCMVGHTHIPLAYTTMNGYYNIESQLLSEGDQLELHGRAILNPGSVGQPRDQDPRASYAIFNPETSLWKACRAAYDIESVQKRILSHGLPLRHAVRLAEGW